MNTGKILILVVLGFTLGSCASVKPDQTTNEEKRRPNQEYVIDNPLTLTDFIRQVAGVHLDWTTGVPVIRGGYPLYVVDGVRIGHDYYEVAHLVNVQDVASVEVIKSPGEGLIYGRDVANGVIVIRTKSGNPELE